MSIIRILLRKLLLRLLKYTGEEGTTNSRTAKSDAPFLQKALSVPAWAVALLIFLVLNCLLFGRMGSGWQGLAGTFLFIAVSMGIYAFYLRKYPSSTLTDSKLVMLLGLIVIMLVLIIILFMSFAITSYLIPIACGVMLITMLIGVPVALISLMVLSVLIAMVNNFDFNYFFVAVMGGLAGIYSTYSVRNRRDLMKAGLYVSAANMLGILMMNIIHHTSFVSMGNDFIMGIGNGFLSVILAIGLLPYLEDVFSIVTNIKLMELADYNQPLLKRLMVEAPGTYHHSMLVGNLAETAAELAGADPLLTRVGAYYHDIGKLAKPEYFTENQINIMNKHEDLTPNMSSLVLITHVKDGVTFAREHKLNKRIVDIIEQHHGTSLIHYFYMKALEKDSVSPAEETKYRYPGPRPRTKEAAIVMLADSVEAAARTVEEPSYERIADVVNTIINNKFTDSQLDDCNITLVNLRGIAEGFINTLTGIYHTRVEYERDESGNPDKKSSK